MIPLSPERLDEVRQLIAADADLQTRLQRADDAAQAAGMIADAAAAKGLRIDPAELAASIVEAAEADSAAALSDAQLDAVAGGMSRGGVIALSLFTLFIGCAVDRLVNEKNVGASCRRDD